VPDRSCPRCGGTTPEGSRFCPHCGSPLAEGGGSTAVIPPPPDETGPVPVARERAEPHLFGVTPPLALLALAVAAVAVAIVLFVAGETLAGALMLAAGLLLLVASVRVARRKPDSSLTRASSAAVDGARDRVSLAVGTFATRSRARRRVARARAELLRLEDRRRQLLLALGRAVYDRDGAATESLRSELDGLDRTAAAKEADVATIMEQAGREVRRARLEAQPTEMVEVPGTAPGESPTGPAIVPEPYPPPDEGTPPEPPRTPEPYPPPDEGEPPQPG
jgi:hypothetical protein